MSPAPGVAPQMSGNALLHLVNFHHRRHHDDALVKRRTECGGHSGSPATCMYICACMILDPWRQPQLAAVRRMYLPGESGPYIRTRSCTS